MKTLFACSLVLFFLLSTALAADDESINVTVVGTLRTGVVVIGGETTGTTITAKGITWELSGDKLTDAIKQYHGKKVIVQGSLERRRGVEVKDRYIINVEAIQLAGDGA